MACSPQRFLRSKNTDATLNPAKARWADPLKTLVLNIARLVDYLYSGYLGHCDTPHKSAGMQEISSLAIGASFALLEEHSAAVAFPL